MHDKARRANPLTWERERLLANKRNFDLKLRALQAYSVEVPYCTCCGTQEISVLTIEHLNNDGGRQRASGVGAGGRFYQWLKTHGYPKNIGLTVRCFNCNISRRVLGDCYHRLQK